MKFKLYVDINRCTGCQTCTVACMDQNDLNPDGGDHARRTIYRIEQDNTSPSRGHYISMGCLHCENAPCIAGCPSGALQKEQAGAVTTDASLCIGCRNCLMLCPFGIPRFNRSGKMQKCDLCRDRTEAGLIPACVRTCPTQALIVDC